MLNKKAEIESRVLLYKAIKGILRTKLAAGPSPVPPGMDDLYSEMGVNPNEDPSAAANRMSQQQAMQAPSGYTGAWPPPQGPQPGTQGPTYQDAMRQRQEEAEQRRLATLPAYTTPVEGTMVGGGLPPTQTQTMTLSMPSQQPKRDPNATYFREDYGVQDPQYGYNKSSRPTNFVESIDSIGRNLWNGTLNYIDDFHNNSAFYDFARLRNDPHAFDQAWSNNPMQTGQDQHEVGILDTVGMPTGGKFKTFKMKAGPKVKGGLGLSSTGVFNYVGAPLANGVQAVGANYVAQQQAKDIAANADQARARAYAHMTPQQREFAEKGSPATQWATYDSNLAQYNSMPWYRQMFASAPTAPNVARPWDMPDPNTPKYTPEGIEAQRMMAQQNYSNSGGMGAMFGR